MAKDKVVEEMTIAGQKIRLAHEDVPIDQIDLDESNPRIRYRLKQGHQDRPHVITGDHRPLTSSPSCGYAPRAPLDSHATLRAEAGTA